jgi:hypothetical protein
MHKHEPADLFRAAPKTRPVVGVRPSTVFIKKKKLSPGLENPEPRFHRRGDFLKINPIIRYNEESNYLSSTSQLGTRGLWWAAPEQ